MEALFIFEIIKLLELKIFHRKYNYIFNFLCANITCYQESMIFFAGSIVKQWIWPLLAIHNANTLFLCNLGHNSDIKSQWRLCAFINIPLPIHDFANKCKDIQYVLLFFGGILWISKRIGMLTFFPINSSRVIFLRKRVIAFLGIKKYALECIQLPESTIFPCMSYWSFHRHNNYSIFKSSYISILLYPFLKSLGLKKTWKQMSYLMPFPELHYNNIHRRKQFAYQAMKTASQLEIQIFFLIEF